MSASSRRREFDALYTRTPDPWGMETSAYEAAKYDATLAALGERRFRSGLEVGCSIGVLSERLAARCERLLGLDVSPVALERAKRRVPAVRFLRAEVPDDWPTDRYDLVVLSEVLYFLSAAEVAAMACLVARDLAGGGTAVVVNWTGENDRPLDGDAAADLFMRKAQDAGLRLARRSRAPLYRMEVYAA